MMVRTTKEVKELIEETAEELLDMMTLDENYGLSDMVGVTTLKDELIKKLEED